MKVKHKLLFLVVGTMTLIYALVFGFIIYNYYNHSIDLALKYTDAVTAENAEKLVKDVDEDIAIVRTLAQGFVKYSQDIDNVDIDVYKNIIKNILEKNPRYSAVALHLELSALDKKYQKDYGRLRMAYFNEGGIATLRIDTLDTHGDNVGSQYHNLKLSRQEDVSEPYLFSPYGDDTYRSLISSVSAPLLRDEKFVGLLQCDILLSNYRKIIYKVKPFKATEAFVVSNNGSFVASSSKYLQQKSIDEMHSDEGVSILQNIKRGKKFSYLQKDSIGDMQYYSYHPLKFGNSENYWALGVVVPYDYITRNATKDLNLSIFTFFIGWLIVLIVSWPIARSISRSLSKVASTIRKLSLGDVSSSHKIDIKNSDELGQINTLVNSLIDGLENNVTFAHEIEQGNFTARFEPLSSKDSLGIALMDMRKSLQQAAIEEKQRIEEEQRINWATEGFAKFSELMRENTDNITEFSYSVISNLIQYLDANQGGLFLINNSDKNNEFVELVASYAYNKRKYIDKKINMGVGLVGRCIDEQETIYMTDFPEDYLNIASGLGQSTPTSLLIVPIIFHAEVFGVVEIASLHAIEGYQIKFVERIGESIGSTISNVKINERTSVLLEEVEIESEKLIAEDAALKKELEELGRVRGELDSKLQDATATLKSMNDVLLIAEFNMQGRLVDINKNFLNLIGKTKHEVVGMFQGAFAVTKDDPRNLFRDFWNELRKGVTKTSYQNLRINDKDYYIFEAYMPIIDSDGTPYKVINISVDLTEAVNNEAMETD